MPHRYRTHCAAGGALFLLLVLSALPARAQHQVPAFDVDVVSARPSPSATQTRVDIYTKIPYNRLQFINTAEGFAARYEVTAAFYELDDRDRRQNLVQRRVWERTVPVEHFASTQAEQFFDTAAQSLEMTPGRYLLEVQVEDAQTREAFVHERLVEVRDLNSPVAISDLILIDAYDAEQNTITPRVDHRLRTDQTNIRLFYELYAPDPVNVRVTREVLRPAQQSRPSGMRALFGLGDDGEGSGEVTYTRLEVMPLKVWRTQTVIDIPIGDLKAGDYLVRVKVEDEDGQLLDVAEQGISLQWTGLAEHIRNLDEAIAQLQYIAKDKDLRYIRSGQTQVERLARFRDFWEKRDPTPGTERNERMEEYYYRIDYANREYGALTDGWKTDQGHVLILFGEPDFVESHPYNFDVKPYEVWYYERIGRRFIFIDETGLGDYELYLPVWDERTRIQ